MSTTIHPTAIVSPKAHLGENVTVGPLTIIEHDVHVGDGTKISSNVLLANGTRLGRECHVHHGAVLGSPPQDLKFHDEVTTLEIGDHTTLREYVTLNRGTHDRWKTTVGSHCFFMAYVHVAHDCIIGNHAILANAVNMGGHVIIEDHAVVGGLVGIHQFSHIGRHTMIGANSRVTKDVPPYVLAGSEPLAFNGLNIVGLRRRNFSQETLSTLEKAYQLIYYSQLNVSQALDRIKKELPMTEEITHIIDFIEKSKRGIIWTRR
ncbi:MAG: acyl-ACP--UDP-N-acetylglucosamine O-acyltransferase [Ignavibacteriae bacterium]|nr:acyl-ACP--UDP-N-acetylglucosamine O-acyltransferase [Ignavibacteria bacterium]MBI3365415.1 acyl-ACP--UDP-N-acetylglucosamine O-acyltransferase [Ignavibacteriota bacterium]